MRGAPSAQASSLLRGYLGITEAPHSVVLFRISVSAQDSSIGSISKPKLGNSKTSKAAVIVYAVADLGSERMDAPVGIITILSTTCYSACKLIKTAKRMRFSMAVSPTCKRPKLGGRTYLAVRLVADSLGDFKNSTRSLISFPSNFGQARPRSCTSCSMAGA